MAIVLNTSRVAAIAETRSTVTGWDHTHWISPTIIMIVCGIVGMLMIAARLYQQVYAGRVFSGGRKSGSIVCESCAVL
jgi:hypothetical protein